MRGLVWLLTYSVQLGQVWRSALSMLRFDRHILPRISGLLMRSRVRFAVPVILVGVFKILGSIWTYNKSLQDGIFGTPWMNIWGPIEPRWLYLFMAWDTSWYVSMAQSLSFSLDRTFFPGYPFLIRVFGYASGNFWLSAFLISVILGFVSLPIFQAIAECYMTKGEALGSTIVMSFFPYIFLFTTVAYSESLFLFAVLTS